MIAGIFAALLGHLFETAKLRSYAVALYAGAAACLLFALLFALGALREWIAITYHAAYPDLWIAAGFVVLAVPFIGFGLWMQGRRAKVHPAASIAMLAGPSAARLAARSLTPRIAAIGVILFAGLAMGRRLTARKDVYTN